MNLIENKYPKFLVDNALENHYILINSGFLLHQINKY